MLLHAYADILSPLNSLTKQFQSRSIDYEEVHTSYLCCLSALRALSQKKLGVRTSGFFDSLTKHANGRYSFKGIYLKFSASLDEEKEVVKEQTKAIADIMINNIEKRFNDCTRLSQFSSLNFTKIKSLSSNNFEVFGVKDVKALCRFYITKGFFNNRFGPLGSTNGNKYDLNETLALEEYQNLTKVICYEFKVYDNHDIYWS